MFCYCYCANILKPVLVIHLLFGHVRYEKAYKWAFGFIMSVSPYKNSATERIFAEIDTGEFVYTSHLLLKFGQQQTITLHADLRPFLCPPGA